VVRIRETDALLLRAPPRVRRSRRAWRRRTGFGRALAAAACIEVCAFSDGGAGPIVESAPLRVLVGPLEGRAGRLLRCAARLAGLRGLDLRGEVEVLHWAAARVVLLHLE
jgi:hypothetical protein